MSNALGRLGAVIVAVLAPLTAHGANACRADAERFCQGIAPGGGRIIACLKSHETELSPGCQQEFAVRREQAAAFREACGPDAQRLCSGVAPGGGRIVACLRSHDGDLSPNCKGLLNR